MGRPSSTRKQATTRSTPRKRRAELMTAAAATPEASSFAVVFEHHQAVALLIAPADSAIVDANPAACAFYGYSQQQLRSMSLCDIEQATPDVVREECELAARQVRQRFEVPHRLASGDIRYVEVTSSPIRLAGMPFLCAIVMDVSRRRDAEHENERRSRDLATLLDVSQAMTMTLDLPSVSQTIVEKACALAGLETGAIYLLHGSMLHLEATTPPLPPNMPEEFREAQLADHPHIQQCFEQARPVAIEETNGVEFSPQERAIVAMRGLRSLLFIPLVIERRPVGVLILGSVGRPRRYEPAEIDLCRTFSVQAAVTAENALMYDTTTRYARELEARILERDRAQQDRLHLESQLFQAQRRESIGTLASGIAHDFNNILSIIIGNATLLSSSRGEQAKDAKRIDAILTATRRATQVVTQLLTIARKTEMVRRPTDVNKLTVELCKLLEETFPRNITVRHDLEAALSPIHADPNQLHQVLLNLCVNARDAMAGGGELQIRTRTVAGSDLQGRLPQADARPYVEISVRDNGEGMDEATRAKLFTPFFTTKGMGKGTGLGLAVSLGIVESHGGFIEVTSAPGAGATFKVYVPTATSDAREPSSDASNGGDELRGSETVLLVEDEPLLRESTAEILNRHGYRVLCASDGDQAIALYRQHAGRIAIMISDYGLPRYDGEELHRRLTSAGANVPFFLVSGFVEVQKKVEMQKAGVREVIMKPFDPMDLLQRIRRALDRPA